MRTPLRSPSLLTGALALLIGGASPTHAGGFLERAEWSTDFAAAKARAKQKNAQRVIFAFFAKPG